MSRKSTSELYAEAGFGPGEVAASGPLRSAFCAGTATADQLSQYSPFAAKWNKFAELLAERDQADAREAAAPDPARHDADQDGGLGAAMRQHRDGQAGRTLTVIRPRLIAVDTGNGAMIDVPEAPEWPLYRGSAGAIGHQRIAAGLSASKKP